MELAVGTDRLVYEKPDVQPQRMSKLRHATTYYIIKINYSSSIT